MSGCVIRAGHCAEVHHSNIFQIWPAIKGTVKKSWSASQMRLCLGGCAQGEEWPPGRCPWGGKS